MAINPFDAATIEAGSALQPAPHGGLVPSRFAAESPLFLEDAHAAFRDFVMQQEFPCVGARAAFNSESYAVAVYDELGSDAATTNLARDLFEFTRSEIREASEYATFVAVFQAPEGHAPACPWAGLFVDNVALAECPRSTIAYSSNLTERMPTVGTDDSRDDPRLTSQQTT